ncbi:uncharacterized protein DUF4830 [Hydrogenoanaerobacterium saccharovorans]|uniref:DUF4830 domain-containing protein n=1 Tax=Hydrogenoanaerobacterium saccharovorans TaxID=474960 RepID=A0A1H8A7X9_9FIRM|nr:DUF4830 domain-containing protein [Hydrogenoanaerobacterium saccharovorans]RPF48107.1 uncharacterized protein DUF4830 [Hydrogenoanaerobacterium saccharovorans]SEM66673.1 protein of unknown function [Hydrogenoanaerobacterium saccharovorans]
MFVKSYKISSRRLLGLGIMFMAVIVLLVYGIGLRISKKGEQVEMEASTKISKNALKGVAKTEKDRLEFISQFGWETEKEPEEIAEIVIPEKFDEVYDKYNKLQKSQNFNLEKFKGKRCKRYTYKITNYPECPDFARINILVLEGKVIGGDVCSTELDGFMHGFEANSATMENVKELPLPEGEETAVVEKTVGVAGENPDSSAQETIAASPDEPPLEDTTDLDLIEMMKILQEKE